MIGKSKTYDLQFDVILSEIKKKSVFDWHKKNSNTEQVHLLFPLKSWTSYAAILKI